MDPVTQAIILGTAEAAKAGADAYASSKESKEASRAKKRQTLAELLNQMMGREFEAGEGVRNRGAELASKRADALQNVASQYVQALR